MNVIVTLPLLMLVLLTAVGAVFVKDLVASVFILGAYSFFLALLWAWKGAVDVAFTEAVVGAGLSTVFFLLTLFRVAEKESTRRSYRFSWLFLSGLLMLGLLMVYGAQDLPPVGDPLSPPNLHISPVYLERTLVETRTPNAVTSIIMDYRAFDTLIETTVIFTAGIATSLLLWTHKP